MIAEEGDRKPGKEQRGVEGPKATRGGKREGGKEKSSTKATRGGGGEVLEGREPTNHGG